ncbi:MAG: hypothetical protein IT584_01880 [Chlamydiae bacterium]|nr:hypothetical protein [Chlamydiota bacterium]
MKMIFYWLVLPLFAAQSPQGGEIASSSHFEMHGGGHLSANQLKKRLIKAQKGDYIVTEANKMITVLAVRSKTASSIIFEEITVPVQQVKQRPKSWAAWVKNKAPGHTSWAMIEIDLSSDQLLECYSFSRSAWLKASNQESLLTTLLHLPLRHLKETERKKIGPAPSDGEADHRQIWNPPLTVNGQKIEKVHFDAYETAWPNDNSELSGKTITLYFDENEGFPLPYWIQVDATHGNASLRVIDSGSHLPSHYHKLPRRVPEFVGSPRATEKGLQICLKSPKYYKTFELFAIDITHKEKQILPISHFSLETKEEMVRLEIPHTELSETLEAGHRYTWLLVPTGFSEYYTESMKPFYWNP